MRRHTGARRADPADNPSADASAGARDSGGPGEDGGFDTATPRRATLRARLRGDDAGTILPLTIFFGFLCLVLILLVVSASSLYLERKRLFTLADGAAVVGAEAYPLSALSPTTSGLQPRLTPGDIRTAVDDYLDSAPGRRFEQLSLDAATTDDGESARVTLSAYWRPPLLSLLVPEGLRVEVTAVSRSVFR